MTSIKTETKQFILAGLYKNKHLLRFTELMPYLNSGLFLISINLLVHTILDVYFSIIFNCVSCFLFIIGLGIMIDIIMQKQEYNVL